ncbi:putative leucine-rich repeat-containing protein DDB_G0281931 [Montipora capricornis]|uniref:putative leucine-rich repeat-containing protein DDB_G0281931 n=1 Tax=Montipora capricornis TaxID=246305 RepID=UPI0035F1D717
MWRGIEKDDSEFIDISDKSAFLRGPLREVFLQAGFANYYDESGYKLLPCPPGTFVDISDTRPRCKDCPAGGYYSDTAAFVSDSCQRCPIGTFVHKNKAPGKSALDCSACPQGTDTKSFAGFRACYCLKGFFRRHMFADCESCEQQDGLECENDAVSLQPGYWWKWENDANKELYKSFSDLLQGNYSVGNQSIIEYRYPLPQAHKCPRPESCLGGIHATCFDGYEGPLCEVCSPGYYKQLKTCKECPSKAWMIAQLSVIAAVTIIITAVVVWRSRKEAKNKQDRSLPDIILGRLKIVIGFYQVTFGVLEAFAYIKWPDSLALIGKYSEMLQLNIFQIAPIHCLFPDLKVNAFGRLFAVLGINAAVVILAFISYGIRKVLLSKKIFPSQVEKEKNISETKELVYRTVFFFLYITYLSTCSKTANVLPQACQTLCLDEKRKKCDTFLKVDFNVKCSSQEFRRSVIVAYCSILYIMFLPMAVLVVLWRHQRSSKKHDDGGDDESTHSNHSIPEIVTGLHFLFANYNSHSWYWELVETARKVTLTSSIILIGGESRAYVGLACVMSGLYGMFFAYKRPIADPFENSLMVSSLAVTFVNLGIGAVSRIPAEGAQSLVDSYMDHIMFKALVFGANFLVIGILVVQYVRYFCCFIKEWRKNPHCSLSCCLALLLPLNDLQNEIRGMTGKNLLKQQVQSGKLNAPSVSSTLKESGAVSFELATIHEQPKESGESRSVNFGFEESDNGGLEEKGADQVKFDTRDSVFQTV